MKKKLFMIVMVILSVFVSSIVITSCNVTRVTKTESSFFQRGDTTVQIHTKTIESYDATKKGY